VEILHIYKHQFFELDWQGEIEKTQWLELLRPFTVVKKLCISKEYAPRIMLALRELVGDIRTEVVPALQNIFWRSTSHRDQSGKALSSSFLRDSSPITL